MTRTEQLYVCSSLASSPRSATVCILAFVRSHGLSALIVDGSVHFDCCDGIRHRVGTMAEAREALGY